MSKQVIAGVHKRMKVPTISESVIALLTSLLCLVESEMLATILFRVFDYKELKVYVNFKLHLEFPNLTNLIHNHSINVEI